MTWAQGNLLQEGKYLIKKELGKGGFGTTYLAIHTLLNQYFVIKALNEDLQHDPNYQDHVRRFKREGRILLRLSSQTNSPNSHIVGVRDLFQEEDIYCLVMDFVDGENLFKVVKKYGKMPETRGLKYIQQIGKALCFIHQAGLTHRDVHPGNIMIDRNGNAILIDFGLTKNIQPSIFSTKNYSGNPVFAPYEQLTQASRKHNVDVYSLAASLYFIVTGTLPTDSMNRKFNGIHLTQPRNVDSSISDRVNNAIIAGMALEAKNRPQSMKAFLNLLITPKNNQDSGLLPTLNPATIYSNQKPTKIDSNKISPPGTLAKIFSTRAVWGWLLVVILLYAIGFAGIIIDGDIDDFFPNFSIDETVLFGLIIGAVDGLMALALTLTLKSWVRVLVIALMLLLLRGSGIMVLIVFGFMNLTGAIQGFDNASLNRQDRFLAFFFTTFIGISLGGLMGLMFQ